MAEKRNENGFVGWLNCQNGNFFGCFLRKCLDTKISWKLFGFLLVSLVGIGLLITVNILTLDRIQKIHHDISSVQIPQYKISQYILRNINGFKISLLHMMDVEDLNLDDKNVIANQERLTNMEMMILAMKNGGNILDVAKVTQKTLDVFTISPTSDPDINSINDEIIAEFYLLEESFNELVDLVVNKEVSDQQRQNGFDKMLASLDKIHHIISRLTIEINNRNNSDFLESERTIEQSQSKSLIIGLMVALILVSGSILYMLLIVSPLKDITEKIRDIASGESDQNKRIDVKTNDEIGILAQHLNRLIDNIFRLNTFKAVIEEEETTKEVNQRLSAVLHEKFGLEQVFIYEISNTKNNMTIAYASDPQNICSTQILDDSNFCRAKRTGHPVSSVQYPDICKVFPHRESMHHHCIPMIASGKVIGIVQFIHDKVESEETLVNFEKRIKGAARYIEEATPVIEAKRFASALQETTLRDPMTDLYNRRFLETYSDTLVASTMRRANKVGIMMCDMDFFKEVNDNFGHETGDIVIVKTAEILKSCVRASDMIIRYGGEEFLILLVDINDRDDIIDLAERIRATMESTSIKHPDGTLNKTISIGYSEFPDDTDGFWEAIKFADIALYRAKQEGRNRVVGFTRDMWDREEY